MIDYASASVHIIPWPDAVIDALGHDPRSTYVERFWLGVLGPSSIFLLRRIAAGLEASPDGFDLDLAETAGSIGLAAPKGRHSPFVRTMVRCCPFKLAQPHDARTLAVRRRLPPLTQGQVRRLPAAVQAEHAAWQRSVLHAPEGPEAA